MWQFLNRPALWVFAVAIGVSGPLGYLALNPTRFADISIIATARGAASVPCPTTSTQVYNDVARFQFSADLEDANVTETRLTIQHGADRRVFDQPLMAVNSNAVRGYVEVGSQEFPLLQDEEYSFTLEDTRDRRHLLSGLIRVRIIEVAGGSSRMLAVLAIVASVLQVFQAIALVVSRQKPRVPRKPLPAP